MIATHSTKGTIMAAQTSGKITATAKKDTSTVRTSTVSAAATGQPVQPTAQQPQRPPQRPAPSDRSGIRLNIGGVYAAVDTGTSSRAVKAIQYALADRGFDPGTRSGYFDQGTKDAYARYQDSIHESGDGVPTEHSLNYLGFDLI